MSTAAGIAVEGGTPEGPGTTGGGGGGLATAARIAMYAMLKRP